nr:lysoplasmalogenase [Kordiimonas marina]
MILLSVAAAVAYGAGWYPDGVLAQAVAKGAAVGLLALFVLISSQNLNHLLLFLALCASVAGDVFLVLPHTEAFLHGLLGFLTAHIMFVILYFRNRLPGSDISRARFNAAVLVWVATGISYIVMYPHLGALLWPVIGYSALLALMTTTALLSGYSLKLVGLGAVLFLISDALLGANQFLNVPAFVGQLVWGVYFTAQLLMTLGVMLGEDRRSTSFGSYRFD